MSAYWKNLYDSISKQFDDSLLRQVGKTINGQELPEQQVKLIVESITKNLELNSTDSVVDLCCGNGLITERLAPLVNDIFAVDFSEGLIEVAKSHNKTKNVTYVASDILNVDSRYFSGSKKILMNEALQHLTIQQFESLLDNLKVLESNSPVFFGGIADREKLRVYYDTEEKFSFYEQRELEGKPHMGRWWLREEIAQLASTRGFKATFLEQEPDMYTAYYRFNALLEKLH